MTLSRWYSRLILVPFALLLVGVLAGQVYFLWRAVRVQKQEQDRLVEQVTQIASLSVTQKNRAMLETALILGLDQSRSVQICLQADRSIVFSLPPAGVDQCEARRSSPLVRKWERELLGLQGYRLLMWSPIFPPNQELFQPLVTLLLLFGAAMALLTSLLSRLKSDILAPLEAGLAGSEKLAIHEMEAIRQKALEVLALRERSAVTEAVRVRNRQVAHDVRAPLAALAVLRENLATVSIEQHELLIGYVPRWLVVQQKMSNVLCLPMMNQYYVRWNIILSVVPNKYNVLPLPVIQYNKHTQILV